MQCIGYSGTYSTKHAVKGLAKFSRFARDNVNYVSLLLLMIQFSQWASKKFNSYCKIVIWNFNCYMTLAF